MAITLRSTKGTSLSYSEMDENFDFLDRTKHDRMDVSYEGEYTNPKITVNNKGEIVAVEQQSSAAPATDITGSVFGDDSTKIVDGVENKVYAANGFFGNLTGDVTGNITGNLAVIDSLELKENTISTTDSSGIVITESLTALSSLTVDDDIIIKGGIVYPDDKIKIGNNSGSNNQQIFAVAIGTNAGQLNQGETAIAIGVDTGSENQGNDSVAVGSLAGQYNQGGSTVSVGERAGNSDQEYKAIAVGSAAGAIRQGQYSVAMGSAAGFTDQGQYSIAIGRNAGNANQHESSIVLNATGSSLNSDGAGRFFVKPVREDATGVVPSGFYPAYYNPTTGEFIYLS